MAGVAYGALSLAQVEEELRSAEAYLTASRVPPPSLADEFNPGDIDTSTDLDRFTRNGSGQDHGSYRAIEVYLTFTLIVCVVHSDDSNFRRKLKTRPVLSEERRREILAKLSSERQAVLRGRNAGDAITTGNVSEENHYRTPEERHQLVQKLLSERNMEMTSESTAVHDVFLEGPPMSPIDVDRGNELNGEFQHETQSAESDDEIYYASDILDSQPSADIQPRSRLDFVFEGEEAQQGSDSVHSSEAFPTETDMDFSALLPGSNSGVDEPVPSSLFAKLLSHQQKDTIPASEGVNQIKDSNSFDGNHQFVDTVWRTTDGHAEDPPENSETAAYMDYRQSSIKKLATRIDFLAQPRNQTFAEREKQRILLEMEQLRECTFHPNVQKPPRSISKPKNLVQGKHPGMSEFQWLTLSPRQKIFRQTNDSKENSGQDVIQRLHLDGNSRYDSRDRAREALEAQKLEECTFKPRINPTSKSMFSMVDYKPIHHRVSDLQRAKAEYIERIREQLDLEECGSLPFTPVINPKSREIAENKLAEREAEAYNQHTKPKTYEVTDRLAEDADAMAERRLATQEYVDMLNEQPFVPKISEVSKKIVELKPEFQMDFVARQEYFQSRDQEKMEALEGFCDMDYTRGGKLTFKPDIGNAEGVLKHLRPERSAESSQQKLYRLTYNDQREVELKKQRLREEQYGKYSFKPEINPVSKALGRSSTLDELSHPVIGLQQDPPDSKPHERTDSSTSRVALRQYFANKRFRSRVALEMEEASKAECTFQPNLVASKPRNGSASTSKLYNREPRSRTKLEWQSENLLHLIEAERQKKADDIEAKRNVQELKELEECTFQPNLNKPRQKGKLSSKGSPSPPRDSSAEEKPVIVRGLGRFLELKDLARKQQAEQKQREQKVFAPNSSYEPRSYTVPKPFKLSETSKDSIKRRLKVREEMRAKERQECTFKPQTVSSQSRRVLQNMLKN
ncbi:hypothetical protein P3T76_004360 [Phytophthora citrophthora]|uniref:Uncharacterized protein n=1 Tax=Phytophthora citrophthora TaxID=4793 RepID=A0AAD9GUP0_9STRA|nr:hypothetical protein P3T76_004360 [Phytophthora citrophthora]